MPSHTQSSQADLAARVDILIPFSAYNVLYRDGHVPLPRMTNEQVLATSNL